MVALGKRFLWLAPLLLAGVAFVLRAAGQADVFVEGDVVPIGGEAWYHLRRHAFGLARFPALLGFDPYLRFAQGAVPPWAPGFDALIGWLAAASEAGEAIFTAQRLAAWAPSLCGALCVPAVYALLVRRLGVAAAISAASLLTILPAHIVATQVGYVSHRAAGALLGVVVLACTLPLLRGGERAVARDIGLPTLVGLASAFALWVSMLAWLPIVVAHTALFLYAVTRSSAGDARTSVARVALAELVTLAGVALFAWPLSRSTVDPFAHTHPSHLHVTVFAVWFAVAACLALAWRGALGRGWGLRVASFLCIGLAFDALALALAPGLWDVARALPAALFGDPSLHAAQREPALGGGFGSVGELVALLTGFGPALPLLLVLALALEWRSQGRAELLTLVGFAAALAAAAWLAPGGFALGAVAVAIATGCAIGAIVRRSGFGWASGGVALAVLLVALPALLSARTPAEHVPGIEVGNGRLDPAVADHVFEWLAQQGRPGGEWLDVGQVPPYGVLAPWELGHRLLYKGRRAPLIDGFSPVLAPGRRRALEDLYRQQAFRGARQLESLNAQYVILPDLEGFPSGDVPPDSMVSALLGNDGIEVVDPQGGNFFAIAHLRLVYEHGDRASGGGLRVYERVRGVQVVGASMPDRLIRFSLRLRTSGGREFTYSAAAVADSYWGNYEIRLPYSTLETKRERFVEPLGSWKVECGDEVATLDVKDWRVRKGAQVTGPGLCF
ncbi:MAG: hypothetical protein JRH16_14730 [Deltaproteobacteria bacterium]|nr:hypothetical protein [Deltaproteobacteria bacterium]MBW2362708.1 hypothetical protein [Deltaproteobacteria bacterium]